MDNNKDWRSKGTTGKIILTNDISDSITYMKALMTQNIKG
jgi:hypothetical protein